MVVVIRSDGNRDTFNDADVTWDIDDGLLTVFTDTNGEDKVLAQYLGWLGVYNLPEGSL